MKLSKNSRQISLRDLQELTSLTRLRKDIKESTKKKKRLLETLGTLKECGTERPHKGHMEFGVMTLEI